MSFKLSYVEVRSASGVVDSGHRDSQNKLLYQQTATVRTEKQNVAAHP